MKQYGTIPREWGHSKLVTLWKGPDKGKADDPNTYRGLQIGSSLCKIMIIVMINRLKRWYEQNYYIHSRVLGLQEAQQMESLLRKVYNKSPTK